MHEIDPQSDSRLKDALRHLAASSRDGAPAQIAAGLAMAFRRHHARRRLVRRISVGALAACIALIAGLLSMRSSYQVPGNPQAHEAAGSAPITPSKSVAAANTAATPVRPAGKRSRPKAATISTASHRQFLALPGYDPEVPADELHVVRVQLPASALWQMGAPVSPDLGGRKFMADFVVSQDGTPYAVRLVQ